MTSKIQLGILGCSSIAERSIIPSLAESGYFDLAAVASRSDEKGRDFAGRFQCGHCSYDELLGQEKIEAVYVSLPVGLHYEWAKKVILSGKHLLLEKTFTDAFGKAEEIIRMAEERQLVAMEALMYVYHPLFQKILSIIKSGEIGNIRQIEADFGIPYLPDGNIRYHKELGGGAVLDNLIYPLSFCLSVNPRPLRSISHNLVDHEKYDIDARGFVKLDWNDCSAFMSYGFGFAYRNTCSVWGDKGRLTAERVFTRPPDLSGAIRISRDGQSETIEVPAADHFTLMLEDFYRKIKKDNPTSFNERSDILGRMKIISDIYHQTAVREGTVQEKEIEISVVIPVYYSKDIIQDTVSEIETALKDQGGYEIILVNDGSTDGSFEVLKKMAAASPRIKCFNLMKNFGQHNAILAGLNQASGRYIVLMDDDGQHDPNYIEPMIDTLKQGYDAVYTKYEKKKYGLFKNLGSKLNDMMSTLLLEKPSGLYLSSFKAVTRNLRDQIIRYPGPFPYIDGIIFSSTRNVAAVPAEHRGTEKSASTYSFKKLIGHWLNMFTNFSVKPLRLIFFLGCLIGSASTGMLIGLTFQRFFNPDFAPPGWTMLAALLLFFGSIQLVCLGLVGEYIGRILLLINKQPQFIIRERID